MASTLYLDCLSGLSGDMFLSGLFDLGLNPRDLERELAKLRIPEHVHLRTETQVRCGISGTYLHIDVHSHSCPDHSHSHGPEHGHSHTHSLGEGQDHGHTHGAGSDPNDHVHGRSFTEIKQIIARSALPDLVKSRAISVFRRIGIAEAHIHGKSIEEIHFHEVGAIDSIVDIIGACAGLHLMGIRQVLASPLVDGTGTLKCAHGVFPIPAPATLAILKDVPLTQINVPFELITPTGAALLAEFAESFAPLDHFTTERIGYGLGTRDLPGRPNVIRMLLGKRDRAPAPTAPATLANSAFEHDEVAVLTTNIDDVTPEVLAAAADALLEAGALDVTVTPALMKKGRSGFQLEVLAPVDQQNALAEIILRSTPAIGLRVRRESRLKLPRQIVPVQTPWGTVRVKIATLPGGTTKRKAEFEDCRKISTERGIALSEVMRNAESAAE
jgi:pyridinium-3,5-bisthiocarboxylic acid mononucleotide nickel chelatase